MNRDRAASGPPGQDVSDLAAGLVWFLGCWQQSVTAQLGVLLSHVTRVISSGGRAMFYLVSGDSILDEMDNGPLVTYAVKKIVPLESFFVVVIKRSCTV